MSGKLNITYMVKKIKTYVDIQFSVDFISRRDDSKTQQHMVSPQYLLLMIPSYPEENIFALFDE